MQVSKIINVLVLATLLLVGCDDLGSSTGGSGEKNLPSCFEFCGYVNYCEHGGNDDCLDDCMVNKNTELCRDTWIAVLGCYQSYIGQGDAGCFDFLSCIDKILPADAECLTWRDQSDNQQDDDVADDDLADDDVADDDDMTCQEAYDYMYDDCGLAFHDEDNDPIEQEWVIGWCEDGEDGYSDAYYNCINDNFGNCDAAGDCLQNEMM